MHHATPVSRARLGALLLGLSLALSVTLVAPLVVAGRDAERAGYIVVLHDTAGTRAASAVTRHADRLGVRPDRVYSHALSGYAARLTAAQVSALRADPRVASVERDAVVRLDTTQPNATWGLDRIDQRNRPLSGTYTYTSTGSGVTAYIIDTGIRLTHNEFGGRAVAGFDAISMGLTGDCNGHGTHVAGTVGGATYGVAKNVRLVAVRVLDCAGVGLTSWVIAGVDWVTGNHQAGQPAVANMSLGGGASAALDTAVRNSIADGVTYAVAAGNETEDACTGSPSRVSEALTVGASDQNDARATFSDFGSCVDWFAPGVSITSAWFLSNTSTNTISGTSMATPHTAGVAAQYLQTNPGASPAAVRTALFDLTTKGIVTSSNSTNNHLLFTSL